MRAAWWRCSRGSGFESLKVIHPHGARQAALRDVRHTECEFGGDDTVQDFGVLADDGVTELLFELAGLLSELRIDIGRRGQLTYRAGAAPVQRKQNQPAAQAEAPTEA